MRIDLPALGLALALAAAPAGADEATDRLFAPGALADVASGATLTFARTRAVPDGARVDPIEDGTVTVAIRPEGELADVRFEEGGRPAGLPPTPVQAAHPVLLLFLETAHKSVAELTGGSPFYVKNRFIESFASAEVEPVTTPTGAGEKLVYRPFEGDPNTDRMGELAALELTFVLSDAVPGGLYSATASAGGYSESIAFSGTEAK